MLFDDGGKAGMAPDAAGGIAGTGWPFFVVIVPPVEPLVTTAEEDGAAVGLTGASAGSELEVTVAVDAAALDAPEPDATPDDDVVAVGAGEALAPGGGASASVVTTLVPEGGSEGAGVNGGIVSPTALPLPWATAEPGSVNCRPTRMR